MEGYPVAAHGPQTQSVPRFRRTGDTNLPVGSTTQPLLSYDPSALHNWTKASSCATVATI